MIIATAGHVDHGKTSLVNALTGVNTDRLEEEKQRGLTIDLGFAYSDAESGERLGFVDVPGHIKFINNMLAGVSAIDYAMLVIAADDGVMPQTIEHLEILNLLGIKSGLIAVTKIDRCDESQIAETLNEISELVRETFLENADVYPVSSTSGEGIETLQIALELAMDDITLRTKNGMFRLAIDRRFSIRGSGIVVTGSIFSGSVSLGDEITLMPQKIPVRVRGLHTQNQEANSATAGDRCAVNITGNQLALEGIHRGNWLTSNPGAATSRVDVRLKVSAAEKKPLSHWTPVHIHSAANHVTGRVALLEPSRIEPGQEGLAQLVFDPPINLCFGDRIIIRDQAAMRTIGGGIVIDPHSPKRGRAKPERLASLQKLDADSAEISFLALIESAQVGLDLARLVETFNFAASEAEELLVDENIVLVMDDLVIHKNHLARNLTDLKQMLDDWHKANPGKAGLPHNQIQQLVRSWSKPLVDQVIAQLIGDGELEQDGNLLKRPGHGVQLNNQELQIWDNCLPLLQQNPTKPPVLHELAKSLSIDPKSLEKILNQVIKTGQIVRPVKNRYFLTEAIPILRELMTEAADEKGQFTVQQFRDVTGIGRNLCIELLEYFDRRGYSRRLGDIRQLVEK